MRKSFMDLAGQTFGRLYVACYQGRLVTPSGHWRHAWSCRCECGNRAEWVSTKNLLSGASRSCGCLAADVTSARVTTHGLTKHPLYKVWRGVRERCQQPGCKDYPRYGGRGIRICERWSDVRNFIEDMGPKPSSKHSIERSDVNGDYTPDNCYWGTALQQCNNKRNNRMLTALGRTQTVAQWAREIGISKECLSNRIDRYGWDTERAVTTPAAYRKPRVKRTNQPKAKR